MLAAVTSRDPIDCLIDIHNTHGLEANDVEEVTVGVLSGGFKVVASPEEDKANPKTVVDMQFSMPFGAAVALAYGRASLEEYADGVPDRPEISRILPRVKCVTDPELDAHFPREWRAWAEVSTADGRRLRSAIRYPKGDPGECPVVGRNEREVRHPYRDGHQPGTPATNHRRHRIAGRNGGRARAGSPPVHGIGHQAVKMGKRI